MSQHKFQEILKDSQQFDRICQEAWSEVDTNKTGYVDEYELGTILNSVLIGMGFYETPEEVDKALSEHQSKEGRISLKEFKEFVRKALENIRQIN